MHTRRAKRWLSVSILTALAFMPACNTAQDSGTPGVTGEESTFEVTGDVTAVNIQDVDVDFSIPPEGIDVDIDASIRVQLTVGVETIDSAAAALCGIQTGSQVVVVVTEDTDLDFDRPLSELNSLEDESIRARGNAHKASGTPGENTEPAGTCELQAENLELVEEDAASPTPANSPSPAT